MTELRKSPVSFDAGSHTYHLDGAVLSGVTSTLIRRAFPDKYSEVDPETLARAAQKGHQLHELIEYHDQFGTSGDEHSDPRVASYDRLKQEFGLTTVANEYLVSDEQRYASSIDIVMENAEGEICLVDIKTTYELDYMSARLQLSIYKGMFELQNPGLEVRHIYVLWLPNKDTSIAELYELQFVSTDVVCALIKADVNDEPFDSMLLYGQLPSRLSEVQDEVIQIEQQLKECKDREDQLKKGLYDLMERSNCKSFRSDKLLLTRILPTKSETVDTKRLKEEMPDVYNKYLKTSARNGSLKITIL